MALHRIVDAENAIELGDLSGVCVEVDEGVVTLGELVDLKGELARIEELFSIICP